MNNEIIMSIEDVFTITGQGTVALGQIQCDEVAIDESIIIDPEFLPEFESEIIGIESFRKKRKRANQGDYVGLTLKGVDKKRIKKNENLFVFKACINPPSDKSLEMSGFTCA